MKQADKHLERTRGKATKITKIAMPAWAQAHVNVEAWGKQHIGKCKQT